MQSSSSAKLLPPLLPGPLLLLVIPVYEQMSASHFPLLSKVRHCISLSVAAHSKKVLEDLGKITHQKTHQ